MLKDIDANAIYSKFLALSLDIYNLSYLNYRKSRMILFNGNIFSNSLIIGEAPGKKEDELLKIFIGKSGMIIRKYLISKQLENRVLFINSIPWRPENNQTPNESLITFYSTVWLDLFRTNKIINNIICMGSVSKYLINNIIKKTNIDSSILYARHPAYLLYKRSKEEYDIFYNQLELFCNKIDKKKLITNIRIATK